MKEINLKPNFDDVAPLGTELVLVSHEYETFFSSRGDGEEYKAVIGVTADGKRLLLQGSAVYKAFRRFESRGFKNPYTTPLHVKLAKSVLPDGREYTDIVYAAME